MKEVLSSSSRTIRSPIVSLNAISFTHRIPGIRRDAYPGENPKIQDTFVICDEPREGVITQALFKSLNTVGLKDQVAGTHSHMP